MSHASRERGVSLIEVIVALVVISGFGAALFVWAGQTLQSARRAEEVLQQTELERNISEFANSLNPAVRPQGTLDLGLYAYEWNSKMIREPVDHVRHPQGVSPYQVGLYNVQIKVREAGTAQVVARSERVIAGFKQVRVRPATPFELGTLGTP